MVVLLEASISQEYLDKPVLLTQVGLPGHLTVVSPHLLKE